MSAGDTAEWAGLVLIGLVLIGCMTGRRLRQSDSQAAHAGKLAQVGSGGVSCAPPAEDLARCASPAAPTAPAHSQRQLG